MGDCHSSRLYDEKFRSGGNLTTGGPRSEVALLHREAVSFN
jgi:hypothetical protein